MKHIEDIIVMRGKKTPQTYLMLRLIFSKYDLKIGTIFTINQMHIILSIYFTINTCFIQIRNAFSFTYFFMVTI